MAATYHLLCRTCGKYLSLGKLYFEENGPAFDGVFESHSRTWHSRDEYFGRTIECFLIVHRNHNLHYVPEGVDELLESETESIDAVDAEEVQTAARSAQPQPDEELKEWESQLHAPAGEEPGRQ